VIPNVYMATVLPPIPTTGVTIDEVSALATRVRDQMLTTLREISVAVPSEGSPVTESLIGDTTPADQGTPTPTIPIAIPSEARIEEPSQIAVPPSPPEPASATASQVLRKDGSENGTETEEDEGMVLVGHPK
jgi:lysophosphatidate acyltransferase